MATNRRKLPPNRWGCKPDKDVCVEHDEPLLCKHGCTKCKSHDCTQRKADLKEQLCKVGEIAMLESGDLLPDQPDGTNDVRHGPMEDTLYDDFEEQVHA